MIKKIDELTFYELLEVSPTANAQDIHKAYERIRRIYDPNSIALYSLFTPEETAIIHQRIEEGYRTLIYEDNRKKYDAMLRSRSQLPEPPPPQVPKYQPQSLQPAFSLPSENRYLNDATAPSQQQLHQAATEPSQQQASPLIAEYTGAAINSLREQRGLTIQRIADTTKVSSRFFEYIEAESFQKLPARPYLRGFLILYAKALGCDPERMTSDYLKRYDAAMRQKLA